MTCLHYLPTAQCLALCSTLHPPSPPHCHTHNIHSLTHNTHTAEYPEVSFQLTTKLMTFLSKQDLLQRFVVLFLLQSNSTETRWQAHALLYSIFHTSQPEHKVS